ncbi:hypothetical protein NON20_20110 [Synechocystis sp. B12]|nr:hypothetical protein NON20_20110 [Synechocystis sp. B12]
MDLSTEIVPIIELSAIANDSKQVFVLNGSLPNQLAGTAVVSLGNITGTQGPNNRPIDSFLISAPNAQQFYVVFGQPWLAADGSLNLADVASDNGFVIDGNLIGNPPTTFETTSQYIDTTPAILINGSNLYLAYKGFGGNNQIYFTVSTNNGQSWNSEVQLPQSAQTIFPPAIAFFNNVLYLAYVDGNNGLNIITSQDQGQTWNAPLALGALLPHRRPCLFTKEPCPYSLPPIIAIPMFCNFI